MKDDMPNDTVEEAMRLARECAHPQANAANWYALRAYLTRMAEPPQESVRECLEALRKAP